MLTFMRGRFQHFVGITAQPEQSDEWLQMHNPNVYGAIENGFAISGFDGAVCVGIAGILHKQDGVGVVWAVLARNAGAFMLPISRKVKRVLSTYPLERFEATVADAFPAADRWVGHLGFHYVGRTGEDHPFGAGRRLFFRG